jgi:hypothetical protein
MRTTATTSPKPSKSRPSAHRTSAPRLDPYAVAGALTLEEWRRTQATMHPVHVVRPQEQLVSID